MGPPPWDTLSNKKKYWYIEWTGEEIIGMRFFESANWEKTENICENRLFCWRTLQKTPRFSAKKGFWRKNFSISERVKDGLSPHVLISFSEFFTKIDFFWGGGALRPPPPSKVYFSLGMSKLDETFRVCWRWKQKTTIKFSARNL